MKRRRDAKKGVPIFYSNELPAGGSEAMSVYQGVLILWDEDRDARILEIVDQLPDDLRVKLVAVQEHEANLFLLWRGRIPKQYAESRMVELANDTWYVVEAKSIG